MDGFDFTNKIVHQIPISEETFRLIANNELKCLVCGSNRTINVNEIIELIAGTEDRKEICARVTHVLVGPGITEGWVILSLDVLSIKCF